MINTYMWICDIINIVDNDNLQEVKPKENGEVDKSIG